MDSDGESGRKGKLVLKEGKKELYWNVPDHILLDPSKPLVVGRTSLADIVMNSPQHPSMLSQRHATLTFDPTSQQWTIEDLQSLNGVYIDGKTRIKASTSITLKFGTEICFGTLIPQNELKYTLLKLSNGLHMLLRVGAKPPTEDIHGGDMTCVTLEASTPHGSESTPLTTERDAPPPIASSSQDMQRDLTPSQTTMPGTLTPPLPTPSTVCPDLTPPLPTPSTVCHNLTPPLPTPSVVCHAVTSPPTTTPSSVNSAETPLLEVLEPKSKKLRLEEHNSTDQAVLCSSHTGGDSNHHTGEQCVEEITAANTSPFERRATNSEAVLISEPPLAPHRNTGKLTSSPGTDKTVDSFTQPACSTTNARPNTSTATLSVTPASQHKPSPSESTTMVIDELFADGAVDKCFDEIVSDAMFGEEPLPSQSHMPASGGERGEAGNRHVDGTSIQIAEPPLAPHRNTGKLTSSPGTDKTVDSFTQPACSTTNARPNTSTATLSVTPASQHKPSPSESTTMVIDELFADGAVDKCFDEIVSDAMFGEEPLPSQSHMPAGGGERGEAGNRHVDGTSIQIQAAKDEVEREKLKLLSNIEALKSELASKELLLGEKMEKEKAVEDSKKHSKSVIDSMQEELTCIICQELFVVAHTLTCSHSFCKSCINKWMKSKKDCPICRKAISTKPVHSLVLDNAIDKMVEKMDEEARKERKKLKESRTASGASGTGSCVVDMLAAASALGVLNPTPTTASSSGGGGGNRSGSGGRNHRGGSSAGRGTVLTTGAGSANSPIVLSSDTPPRRRRYRHPLDYEEEEEDYSDYSDSDDSSVSGLSGHYYGGYGHCFNCGSHGHWANGCPYN